MTPRIQKGTVLVHSRAWPLRLARRLPNLQPWLGSGGRALPFPRQTLPTAPPARLTVPGQRLNCPFRPLPQPPPSPPSLTGAQAGAGHPECPGMSRPLGVRASPVASRAPTPERVCTHTLTHTQTSSTSSAIDTAGAHALTHRHTDAPQYEDTHSRGVRPHSP